MMANISKMAGSDDDQEQARKNPNTFGIKVIKSNQIILVRAVLEQYSLSG